MILPQGRELVAFLPLSELYTEYQYHERLQVFSEKGLECVACDRIGTFLVLSREIKPCYSKKRKKKVQRIHIDIYTDDFVLMTVDHIVPKAQCKLENWPKHATESLDNKQPMCDPCNGAKGHKLLSTEEMRERRRNTNRSTTGIEIIRKLVPNIHMLLGDI